MHSLPPALVTPVVNLPQSRSSLRPPPSSGVWRADGELGPWLAPLHRSVGLRRTGVFVCTGGFVALGVVLAALRSWTVRREPMPRVSDRRETELTLAVTVSAYMFNCRAIAHEARVQKSANLSTVREHDP